VRGQEKKREGLSGERLVKYLRSINKGYCKKILITKSSSDLSDPILEERAGVDLM
jgi:hypothetical protein